MAAPTANTSGDIFLESKRYIQTVLPQGVPWVDRDENDRSQMIYSQFRRVIQTSIGDGGRDDSFKIDESSSPTNNFIVTGGDGTEEGSAYFFLGGHKCLLVSDVEYESGLTPTDEEKSIHPTISPIPASFGISPTVLEDSAANYAINEFAGRMLQPNIEDATAFLVISNTANTITVSAGDMTTVASIGDRYRVKLSTPGAGPSRSDEVYLNVFIDEIDSTEDPDLLHPLLVPQEAQVRLQVQQVIHYREDAPSFSAPSQMYTDADGRLHFVSKLAEISRPGLDTDINSPEITDTREIIVGDLTDFVLKSGDTMTGPLVIDANSANPLLRILNGGASNSIHVDVNDFVLSSTGLVGFGRIPGVGNEFDFTRSVAGSSLNKLLENTSSVALSSSISHILTQGSGDAFVRFGSDLSGTPQNWVAGIDTSNSTFSINPGTAPTASPGVFITDQTRIGINNGIPGATLDIVNDSVLPTAIFDWTSGSTSGASVIQLLTSNALAAHTGAMIYAENKSSDTNSIFRINNLSTGDSDDLLINHALSMGSAVSITTNAAGVGIANLISIVDSRTAGFPTCVFESSVPSAVLTLIPAGTGSSGLSVAAAISASGSATLFNATNAGSSHTGIIGQFISGVLSGSNTLNALKQDTGAGLAFFAQKAGPGNVTKIETQENSANAVLVLSKTHATPFASTTTAMLDIQSSAPNDTLLIKFAGSALHHTIGQPTGGDLAVTLNTMVDNVIGMAWRAVSGSAANVSVGPNSLGNLTGGSNALYLSDGAAPSSVASGGTLNSVSGSPIWTTAGTSTNLITNSGWADDGTVVRLITSTDNVAIGTSVAARQLTLFGSSNPGIQIESTASPTKV